MYCATLQDIRDKIDPVLKSTTSREEHSKKEMDKKHDETKTRWEKDVKQDDATEGESDVKKEKE